MIDILFTVLLFFLLTQNIPLNSFNLLIPETQKEDGNGKITNNTTLHIFPQIHKFAVNSTKIDGIENLKHYLVKVEKSSPISIIVDSKTEASNLVLAMEILNELKFSQVNIITKND